jgi:hypothetical protein
MCEHKGEPFQGVEALVVLLSPDRGPGTGFGCIDYISLLIQVLHPFLREWRLRMPFRVDDIAGQVFHAFFIVGRDAVAAENVESGMTLCWEHGDHFSRNLSSDDEHPEDLVPEDSLQLFMLKGRSQPEHDFSVEAAVHDQNVAMGVKAEKVAEGVDGDRDVTEFRFVAIQTTIEDVLRGALNSFAWFQCRTNQRT